MNRVAQHRWSFRLREVSASWRRALALLLCVSFLLAAIHPAAADLGPARDGSGVSASLSAPSDPCGDPVDGAAAHCCAGHHQAATVAFAPVTAIAGTTPVRFAALSSVVPAWPTNPPPKPPRT
jgi:hypothetical protein